jgi:hypothetical protein
MGHPTFPKLVQQKATESMLFLHREEPYFGWVIAPCDAEETNAAYFANTPVG